MKLDWRLIESAPKDGQSVMLWDDGLTIGYWVSESPFQQMSGWSIGDDDMRPEDDYQMWIEPSHWAPIPDGPEIT